MKNFAAVVEKEIYRGGRPTEADFAGLLQPMKSVLNLEGDDVAGEECALIQRTRPSVEWRWVPISLADIYIEGFPLSLLDYAVHLMKLLPKPLFFHCEHGEDRSGLLGARFRQSTGWDAQRAFEEAKAHGYHTLLNQGLDKTFRKMGAKL